MSWYVRLVNLVRSGRHSRDLDREIDFHIAERVDDLVAGGMTPEAAAREARRRFGNRAVQKERARDVDVLTWLESLVADARYAARAVRASPGFALVAVLSLGLGIGANTAIFTLVDALMLRPLPVARPEELMQLTTGASALFTNPLWEQLRDRQDAFAGVSAFGRAFFDASRDGVARRVAGSWVSGDFFATLGVRPALGRLLARGDDRRGCPALAVLDHAYWRRAYGGDPTVVGRAVTLNDRAVEVVGVAAPEFRGVIVGQTVEVYLPLCAVAQFGDWGASMLEQRRSWFLRIIGRPRAGLAPRQVRARLAALAPTLYAATLPPDADADERRAYLGLRLDAAPAAAGVSYLRDQYQPALLALMGVVAVVLLIACANVANLLLARAAAREREIAIRLAVGAGRGRLVRQLLTESLLLSGAAAALGVLLARWGVRLLVGLLSTRGNVVSLDLSLDARVLAFTLAVAVATALLFGLAPAWRAMRVSPQAAMRTRGRGAAPGFAAGKALVVGQVALSLVLVAVAALLVSTFWRLVTLDPGFRREQVLLVDADLQKSRAPDERLHDEYDALLRRLRAVPGVRAASAAEITPISGSARNDRVVVDGFTPEAADDALAYFNRVSDGYFETTGTAILAGRDFTAADAVGAELVAIVNETMARRFFGGASPLGRSLRTDIGNGRTSAPMRVVGVVRDAKYQSLREPAPPTVYTPLRQNEHPARSVTFALRGAGPPEALATLIPGVRAAVAEVDAGVVLDFATLAAQVDESLARERLLATLSGFFGALALLLAVVGLYGTMSYSVARRRNELGIRIALGAARPRVVRLVLGEVARMVALGLALGALGTLAATRLVAAFLFGVAPSDPTALMLSASALAVVALAAGAAPAWRAARLDPVTALREE